MAFALGDAHALPFADASFDAAVSLRVLMHTPGLAAVPRASCAASRARRSCSTTRRCSARRRCRPVARRAGRRRSAANVEAYRVFTRPRDRARSWLATASASRRRTGSSCCRSRFTSRSGRARAHARPSRGRLAQAAAARSSGRRSPWWRSGARPRHRRDRLHRGPPRRGHLARRGDRCGALVRDPSRAGALAARGHRAGTRRPGGPGIAPGGRRGRGGRLQHRRDLPPGRPASAPSTARQRRGGRRTRRGRGGAPAHGASCTAARSACTATSSIRRPTRTRRSARATSTRTRSSKGSGSRARRPTGRDRADDRAAERHLRPRRPAAAEAVPRGGAPPIRGARRRRASSTI